MTLKPCPFCDGPTKPALTNGSSNLVRHQGKPHCPVMRSAITVEQWESRTLPLDGDVVELLADARTRADYLDAYSNTVAERLYGGDRPSGIWNL